MTSEQLHAVLNGQTGRIGWQELMPHFARGVVVRVGSDEDLLAVASRFVDDDRSGVERLLAAGRCRKALDEDARRWMRRDEPLWAVVVAPWVLVQEARPDQDGVSST